ncbi:membrane proteins related to metalloendopeptidases [Halalkalibacter wakoensis JCM 9140]|uniref:Membrane proteins related to metalloendopeptidases n=1 Tax=Halalkalibacter wakoensis JCM 9140 TaxID=1236970 RepID=W4Q2Q2_9BACI|nr:M23 family metallopeptidase [Halalkalibacter wakoensis]GAE26225.1 membrane proteins related to metalloendopeptidases [Halalkalibacter wakoensis JCM 9140]
MLVKQKLLTDHKQLFNYLPQHILLQTFVIFFMAITLFASSQTVDAEEDQDVHTIYHVYIDERHSGISNDVDAIYESINKLQSQYEEKYPTFSLTVGENIRVIPELVFTKSEIDDGILDKIKESIVIQVEAVALMIDDEPAVYLPSEEEAEETLELFISQYVEEEDYENYLNGLENEELQLEIGEKEVTKLELTEEVTEQEVLVAPEEVLTTEEAVKTLTNGVLEEQPYVVKEGDVLGTIASDHDLTTSQLLELNHDLDENSLIRVGDEITVQDYRPLVKVVATHVLKSEEEIPFSREVKEDDSMYKGDEKVTQEGQAGSQVVTYEITEQNGNVIKRQVLSEEVTKEPVTEIVTKGTKVIPSRGSGTLGWPAVGGYISSYQGNRWGRFHRGIDIARPSNFNILSADNGTVTFAGWSGGYGNLIKINHNNGMETWYAHLASMDVSVGQTVTKGQKIGVMGQTGNSTGIHLHFEVYQNGQLKNPMDFLNR